MIELESVKTRISAPANLSATGIGRVSGRVLINQVQQEMELRNV